MPDDRPSRAPDATDVDDDDHDAPRTIPDATASSPPPRPSSSPPRPSHSNSNPEDDSNSNSNSTSADGGDVVVAPQQRRPQRREPAKEEEDGEHEHGGDCEGCCWLSALPMPEFEVAVRDALMLHPQHPHRRGDGSGNGGGSGTTTTTATATATIETAEDISEQATVMRALMRATYEHHNHRLRLVESTSVGGMTPPTVAVAALHPPPTDVGEADASDGRDEGELETKGLGASAAAAGWKPPPGGKGEEAGAMPPPSDDGDDPAPSSPNEADDDPRATTTTTTTTPAPAIPTTAAGVGTGAAAAADGGGVGGGFADDEAEEWVRNYVIPHVVRMVLDRGSAAAAKNGRGGGRGHGNGDGNAMDDPDGGEGRGGATVLPRNVHTFLFRRGSPGGAVTAGCPTGEDWGERSPSSPRTRTRTDGGIEVEGADDDDDAPRREGLERPSDASDASAADPSSSPPGAPTDAGGLRHSTTSTTTTATMVTASTTAPLSILCDFVELSVRLFDLVGLDVVPAEWTDCLRGTLGCGVPPSTCRTLPPRSEEESSVVVGGGRGGGAGAGGSDRRYSLVPVRRGLLDDDDDDDVVMGLVALDDEGDDDPRKKGPNHRNNGGGGGRNPRRRDDDDDGGRHQPRRTASSSSPPRLYGYPEECEEVEVMPVTLMCFLHHGGLDVAARCLTGERGGGRGRGRGGRRPSDGPGASSGSTSPQSVDAEPETTPQHQQRQRRSQRRRIDGGSSGAVAATTEVPPPPPPRPSLSSFASLLRILEESIAPHVFSSPHNNTPEETSHHLLRHRRSKKEDVLSGAVYDYVRTVEPSVDVRTSSDRALYLSLLADLHLRDVDGAEGHRDRNHHHPRGWTWSRLCRTRLPSTTSASAVPARTGDVDAANVVDVVTPLHLRLEGLWKLLVDTTSIQNRLASIVEMRELIVRAMNGYVRRSSSPSPASSSSAVAVVADDAGRGGGAAPAASPMDVEVEVEVGHHHRHPGRGRRVGEEQEPEREVRSGRDEEDEDEDEDEEALRLRREREELWREHEEEMLEEWMAQNEEGGDADDDHHDDDADDHSHDDDDDDDGIGTTGGGGGTIGPPAEREGGPEHPPHNGTPTRTRTGTGTGGGDGDEVVIVIQDTPPTAAASANAEDHAAGPADADGRLGVEPKKRRRLDDVPRAEEDEDAPAACVANVVLRRGGRGNSNNVIVDLVDVNDDDGSGDVDRQDEVENGTANGGGLLGKRRRRRRRRSDVDEGQTAAGAASSDDDSSSRRLRRGARCGYVRRRRKRSTIPTPGTTTTTTTEGEMIPPAPQPQLLPSDGVRVGDGDLDGDGIPSSVMDGGGAGGHRRRRRPRVVDTTTAPTEPSAAFLDGQNDDDSSYEGNADADSTRACCGDDDDSSQVGGVPGDDGVGVGVGHLGQLGERDVRIAEALSRGRDSSNHPPSRPSSATSSYSPSSSSSSSSSSSAPAAGMSSSSSGRSYDGYHDDDQLPPSASAAREIIAMTDTAWRSYLRSRVLAARSRPTDALSVLRRGLDVLDDVERYLIPGVLDDPDPDDHGALDAIEDCRARRVRMVELGGVLQDLARGTYAADMDERDRAAALREMFPDVDVDAEDDDEDEDEDDGDGSEGGAMIHLDGGPLTTTTTATAASSDERRDEGDHDHSSASSSSSVRGGDDHDGDDFGGGGGRGGRPSRRSGGNISSRRGRRVVVVGEKTDEGERRSTTTTTTATTTPTNAVVAVGGGIRSLQAKARAFIARRRRRRRSDGRDDRSSAHRSKPVDGAPTPAERPPNHRAPGGGDGAEDTVVAATPPPSRSSSVGGDATTTRRGGGGALETPPPRDVGGVDGGDATSRGDVGQVVGPRGTSGGATAPPNAMSSPTSPTPHPRPHDVFVLLDFCSRPRRTCELLGPLVNSSSSSSASASASASRDDSSSTTENNTTRDGGPPTTQSAPSAGAAESGGMTTKGGKRSRGDEGGSMLDLLLSSEYLHPQLLKRCGLLVTFLADWDRLGDDDIDTMWNAAVSPTTTTSSVVATTTTTTGAAASQEGDGSGVGDSCVGSSAGGGRSPSMVEAGGAASPPKTMAPPLTLRPHESVQITTLEEMWMPLLRSRGNHHHGGVGIGGVAGGGGPGAGADVVGSSGGSSGCKLTTRQLCMIHERIRRALSIRPAAAYDVTNDEEVVAGGGRRTTGDGVMMPTMEYDGSSSDAQRQRRQQQNQMERMMDLTLAFVDATLGMNIVNRHPADRVMNDLGKTEASDEGEGGSMVVAASEQHGLRPLGLDLLWSLVVQVRAIPLKRELHDAAVKHLLGVTTRLFHVHDAGAWTDDGEWVEVVEEALSSNPECVDRGKKRTYVCRNAFFATRWLLLSAMRQLGEGPPTRGPSGGNVVCHAIITVILKSWPTHDHCCHREETDSKEVTKQTMDCEGSLYNVAVDGSRADVAPLLTSSCYPSTATSRIDIIRKFNLVDLVLDDLSRYCRQFDEFGLLARREERKTSSCAQPQGGMAEEKAGPLPQAHLPEETEPGGTDVVEGGACFYPHSTCVKSSLDLLKLILLFLYREQHMASIGRLHNRGVGGDHKCDQSADAGFLPSSKDDLPKVDERNEERLSGDLPGKSTAVKVGLDPSDDSVSHVVNGSGNEGCGRVGKVAVIIDDDDDCVTGRQGKGISLPKVDPIAAVASSGRISRDRLTSARSNAAIVDISVADPHHPNDANLASKQGSTFSSRTEKNHASMVDNSRDSWNVFTQDHLQKLWSTLMSSNNEQDQTGRCSPDERRDFCYSTLHFILSAALGEPFDFCGLHSQSEGAPSSYPTPDLTLARTLFDYMRHRCNQRHIAFMTISGLELFAACMKFVNIHHGRYVDVRFRSGANIATGLCAVHAGDRDNKQVREAKMTRFAMHEGNDTPVDGEVHPGATSDSSKDKDGGSRPPLLQSGGSVYSSFQCCSFDIMGVDHLWRIMLNCVDTTVSTKVCHMLADIHMFQHVSPNAKSWMTPSLIAQEQRRFVNRCMEELKLFGRRHDRDGAEKGMFEARSVAFEEETYMESRRKEVPSEAKKLLIENQERSVDGVLSPEATITADTMVPCIRIIELVGTFARRILRNAEENPTRSSTAACRELKAAGAASHLSTVISHGSFAKLVVSSLVGAVDRDKLSETKTDRPPTPSANAGAMDRGSHVEGVACKGAMAATRSSLAPPADTSACIYVGNEESSVNIHVQPMGRPRFMLALGLKPPPTVGALRHLVYDEIHIQHCKIQSSTSQALPAGQSATMGAADLWSQLCSSPTSCVNDIRLIHAGRELKEDSLSVASVLGISTRCTTNDNIVPPVVHCCPRLVVPPSTTTAMTGNEASSCDVEQTLDDADAKTPVPESAQVDIHQRCFGLIPELPKEAKLHKLEPGSSQANEKAHIVGSSNNREKSHKIVAEFDSGVVKGKSAENQSSDDLYSPSWAKRDPLLAPIAELVRPCHLSLLFRMMSGHGKLEQSALTRKTQSTYSQALAREAIRSCSRHLEALLRKLIWELLMLLPTYPRLYYELSIVASDSHDQKPRIWSKWLPFVSESPYRLLYALQLVEALVFISHRDSHMKKRDDEAGQNTAENVTEVGIDRQNGMAGSAMSPREPAKLVMEDDSSAPNDAPLPEIDVDFSEKHGLSENSENGKNANLRKGGSYKPFLSSSWCIGFISNGGLVHITNLLLKIDLESYTEIEKEQVFVAPGASDVEAAVASDLLFVLRTIHRLQRLIIFFLGRYSEYTLGNAVRTGDVEGTKQKCASRDCDSEKSEVVKHALTSKTLGDLVSHALRVIHWSVVLQRQWKLGQHVENANSWNSTHSVTGVHIQNQQNLQQRQQKGHGTNNSNPLFLNHVDALHNVSGDVSKQSLEMIRLILCDVCPNVIHTLFPDGSDRDACSSPTSSFDHVVKDENEKGNTRSGLLVPLHTESQHPSEIPSMQRVVTDAIMSALLKCPTDDVRSLTVSTLRSIFLVDRCLPQNEMRNCWAAKKLLSVLVPMLSSLGGHSEETSSLPPCSNFFELLCDSMTSLWKGAATAGENMKDRALHQITTCTNGTPWALAGSVTGGNAAVSHAAIACACGSNKSWTTEAVTPSLGFAPLPDIGGGLDEFGSLLSWIARKIIARPTHERRRSTKRPQQLVDHYLVGLCGLADRLCFLLGSEVKAALCHRTTLLQHLFHCCLFATPHAKDMDANHTLSLPKCKTKESRAAAMTLLTTLCAQCAPNLEKTSVLLLRCQQLSMNSEGKICPRSDLDEWNFDPLLRSKSLTGHVGLRNLGATCYMNSLMQQFFLIAPLRRGVLSCDAEKSAITGSDGNLLVQLQLMFASMLMSERKDFDTTALFGTIKGYDGNPIRSGEQQDVDEFFNLFGDRLETVLKPLPQHRLLQDVFGGEICHAISCQDCKHRSERSEEFLSLSLDVKGKSNVMESLNLYVQGEALDGSNQYFCQKCQAKRDSIKGACVSALPNTLLLHLKRFEFDLEIMRKVKVNDRCEFPMNLDMKPYTKEGLSRNGSSSDDTGAVDAVICDRPDDYYQYYLRGVLVHSGTADSGHYYSLARERINDDNDPWYCFNDSSVTPFDPSSLPAATFGGPSESNNKYAKTYSAYLLIYERKHVAFRKVPAAKATDRTGCDKVEKVYDVQRSPWHPPYDIEVDRCQAIPKDLFERLWRENDQFLRDQTTFAPEYSSWLLTVAKLSAGEGISPPLQMVQVLTHHLFETLVRARESCGFCEKFFVFLCSCYEQSEDACRWLLVLMCETHTSWAASMLLRCPSVDLRRGFVRLLSTIFSVMAPLEREYYNLSVERRVSAQAGESSKAGEIIVQSQAVHNDDDVEDTQDADDDLLIMDTSPSLTSSECASMSLKPARLGRINCWSSKSTLARFIGVVLLDLLVDCEAHWRRFDQLFEAIHSFGVCSHDEALYLIRCGVILRLVDIYLGDAGGVPQTSLIGRKRDMNHQRPKMGDKYSRPNRQPLLSLLEHLVRSVVIMPESDDDSDDDDSDDDGDSSDLSARNGRDVTTGSSKGHSTSTNFPPTLTDEARQVMKLTKIRIECPRRDAALVSTKKFFEMLLDEKKQTPSNHASYSNDGTGPSSLHFPSKNIVVHVCFQNLETSRIVCSVARQMLEDQKAEEFAVTLHVLFSMLELDDAESRERVHIVMDAIMEGVTKNIQYEKESTTILGELRLALVQIASHREEFGRCGALLHRWVVDNFPVQMLEKWFRRQNTSAHIRQAIIGVIKSLIFASPVDDRTSGSPISTTNTSLPKRKRGDEVRGTDASGSPKRLRPTGGIDGAAAFETHGEEVSLLDARDQQGSTEEEENGDLVVLGVVQGCRDASVSEVENMLVVHDESGDAENRDEGSCLSSHRNKPDLGLFYDAAYTKEQVLSHLITIFGDVNDALRSQGASKRNYSGNFVDSTAFAEYFEALRLCVTGAEFEQTLLLHRYHGIHKQLVSLLLRIDEEGRSNRRPSADIAKGEIILLYEAIIRHHPDVGRELLVNFSSSNLQEAGATVDREDARNNVLRTTGKRRSGLKGNSNEDMDYLSRLLEIYVTSGKSNDLYNAKYMSHYYGLLLLLADKEEAFRRRLLGHNNWRWALRAFALSGAGTASGPIFETIFNGSLRYLEDDEKFREELVSMLASPTCDGGKTSIITLGRLETASLRLLLQILLCESQQGDTGTAMNVFLEDYDGLSQLSRAAHNFHQHLDDCASQSQQVSEVVLDGLCLALECISCVLNCHGLNRIRSIISIWSEADNTNFLCHRLVTTSEEEWGKCFDQDGMAENCDKMMRAVEKAADILKILASAEAISDTEAV